MCRPNKLREHVFFHTAVKIKMTRGVNLCWSNNFIKSIVPAFIWKLLKQPCFIVFCRGVLHPFPNNGRDCQGKESLFYRKTLFGRSKTFTLIKKVVYQMSKTFQSLQIKNYFLLKRNLYYSMVIGHLYTKLNLYPGRFCDIGKWWIFVHRIYIILRQIHMPKRLHGWTEVLEVIVEMISYNNIKQYSN